jgi:hypothetical protein
MEMGERQDWLFAAFSLFLELPTACPICHD